MTRGGARRGGDRMLAGHRRLEPLPKPKPKPLAVYPCDIVERAEERREREETRLRYRGAGPEPELDWYEEQLRDAEESKWRRLEIWVDSLSEDELAAMSDQAAATTGHDLRRELHDARGYPSETPGGPRPLDR